MSEELQHVLERVRERVQPSQDERNRLEQTTRSVMDRAKAAVDALPVEADVIRVGSTARDTWLRGERDIDVFVRFSNSLEREELRQYGLEVGRSVLPDGQLEYAEHPYVSGEFEGYMIDLVPCFAVESGNDIRSAVDRTPFHAAYVKERLNERLANDVRVLKRFCEAIGIYGSDLRTQGFSGYLTELLILEYGTFEAVIEAASEWRPPVRFDPEDHGSVDFDDPLVVIDPTDPARNVAAVVTAESVAKFQHYARELLANPGVEKFEIPPTPTIDAETLRSHLSRRNSTPIAIRFPVPSMVEDQLYPQLRRTRDGIVAALGERGFLVTRAAIFHQDDAVIFLELAVAKLPTIERHAGPPVHVKHHARAFLDQWEETPVYGPFISGDRYIVERERKFSSASALLRSDEILSASLGAELVDDIAENREISVGDQIIDLLPEFSSDLAQFYNPRP